VPDYCTCGAQLPPDSRFCHKCGKPQTHEALVESLEAELPPPPTPTPVEIRPQPIEISFRNPLAVRIALFLSIVTFGLTLILSTFVPVWMVAAGMVAVYLYRRRTGQPLNAQSGARLGWITGVFMFVIAIALFSVLAIALTDRNFVDALMAQMKAKGTEETAKQFIEAFQNPAEIAKAVAGTFVFCGLLPMIGGLLGSLMMKRIGPRPVN
jgi:hypothetical protein